MAFISIWRKQKIIYPVSKISKNLSQFCPSPYANPNPTQSQQARYLYVISCFPQMKPENRAADGGELTSTEGASNKAIELTDDEKAVLNLLKANSPIDLNELKGQTGLSN